MKSPLEAVHPELRRFASKMPQMTFTKKHLRWIRFLDKLIWIRKKPDDISIVNLFIAGSGPEMQIRLRVYRPKESTERLPVLIWFHGGGFMVGAPEQDDETCIQYVREAGIVVVSVDYHRAPEHPFPAALEDGYAAMYWAHGHADLLGIDPKRIAVGGSSAGGGLAATVVQFAMDDKEIRPVFQLLVYPMLDDRSAIREDLAERVFYGWSQGSNRLGWESYLGTECGSDVVQQYAVPGRRANLSGMPPTWIGVGTLDLFHDEDVVYGQRLQAGGVPCEIYEVEGAFHGFDLAGLGTQVVREFRASQIAALKKYLVANGRSS